MDHLVVVEVDAVKHIHEVGAVAQGPTGQKGLEAQPTTRRQPPSQQASNHDRGLNHGLTMSKPADAWDIPPVSLQLPGGLPDPRRLLA
jgi:hypothetical protein